MLGEAAKRVMQYISDVLEAWDVETLREDVDTSPENETSIVIRGMVEGKGFMLTGDAGIKALNSASSYMKEIGEDSKEDISFYQIPHHGGRHNVSPSILNRMIEQKADKGTTLNKVAFALVSENSDHPLKMVTNAYIRRGVKTYKTEGNTICHHEGKCQLEGGLS